ncbi:MAG: hypothetical protein ACREE0_06200 [Phenylobacterium sp.]
MESPITPGNGAALVALLEARDGTATILVLQDGQRVLALNCAWGRDIGADWEHLTVNVSPSVDGVDIEFLSTAEVVGALDPDTGAVLYRRRTDGQA